MNFFQIWIILDRNLTLEREFLLVLALAKRVGELHGLSAEVHSSEGWHFLAFSSDLDFMTKTPNPSTPDDRFDRFTVPSL